jgi:FKBP-type peptidyl-prolyl cis-trans isomerase 2
MKGNIMTQAKNGDTVKVHYTGRLEDGTEFDTSADRAPLEFTIGHGEIISGFEQAVIGMSLGEEKTIKIDADEAYGPYREDMVLMVDRDQFPAHIDPQVGQQFEIHQADNQAFDVVVTEVSASSVTLDANHPLAGEDLIFDIQLVEIA